MKFKLNFGIFFSSLLFLSLSSVYSSERSVSPGATAEWNASSSAWPESEPESEPENHFEFSFPKRSNAPSALIASHDEALQKVTESDKRDKKSPDLSLDIPKLNDVQDERFLEDESPQHISSLSGSDEVLVRKCCDIGEAFIESLNSCAQYSTEFTVTAYITRRSDYLNVSSDQMHIQEGLLTACAPSILNEDEFILFDSGEIFSSELNAYFYPEHYCLENIVDDSVEPNYIRLTAAYCPISNFPQTFDPSKVPVRKCCPKEELVSAESAECTFRGDVTPAEWTVPVEYAGQISSSSINFTSIYEIVAGYPECVVDQRGESLDSSWDFEVSESSGYLHIPSLGILTPSYCIDDHHISGNKSFSFAYVCLTESDHRKFTQANPSCQPGHDFCVAKCCPAGQLLNQEGGCVFDDDYLMAPQAVPIHFENGTVSQVQNIDFNFGSPLCGGRGIFVTKEDERGEIMANGSLRFISHDPNECDPKVIEYIPQKDYCYDLVRFQGLESQLRGPVPGALICYPKDFEADRQTLQVNYIYSIFLIISDIFILISFVIYLTVPDQTKRGLNKNVKLGHSILGRILLSFLFSLFVAYLCLIITKTASDPINLASNGACVALGVTMYIAFLATFFWLNILCFELWWKCARQESTSGRRWLWYQVYAWGNPVILGAVVLFIEFSPSVGPCFVKPNFGIHSCFFSETRTYGAAAKWVYLNGPVAVLLLTDLLFFLLTVKTLLQTVQQSHKGTVKRQARQRLKLCFKLFLVMGICWLTEIISVATSTTNWYITEVFNCLQGFVIFLIFILKPKILHAVRERICCGKHKPRQPLRGRLTFTASVLSDFLSSTKRSHPSLSTHTLSTSSFSTGSPNQSWGGSLHFPTPSSSPDGSHKILKKRPFLGFRGEPITKEEPNLPSKF